MSYFTQLTFALPDDCSFKGPFCSWINDNNDDFDWLINSGDTMTQNTGPTSDADGDGEYEIFFLCGERALRSFPKKKLPRLSFMLKCYMRTDFRTGLFTVTKFETKVA